MTSSHTSQSDRRDWEQQGFFADADGALVKCYDHVTLLVDAPVESQGRGGPFDKVPAGTTAVPLFYTVDEPVILELECWIGNGICFAQVPPSQVRLLKTGEELRGVDPLPEQRR